ncbi:uncharacterized protein LOC114928122 [Nylanderia fulva]|uniref:uncharacterized protein LOC114928122 n=1 Tax=Nylanderia fulva TaxID=613905 RepID=UPI0010FB08B3|nr:uncharacterized protein LOC114928122 [Nylanderia fulva]
MKQVIFIFGLFIAVTMGLSDDVTERMAEFLMLSKTDVQICVNKTSVTIEDLAKLNQLVDDNVETADIDKSVSKVGCFFACLLQKKEIMSGSYINVEKLKEFVDVRYNTGRSPNPRHIVARNRIFDTCAEQVKSKTDECEVTIKFILCLILEAKRFKETFM